LYIASRTAPPHADWFRGPNITPFVDAPSVAGVLMAFAFGGLAAAATVSGVEYLGFTPSPCVLDARPERRVRINTPLAF